MTNHLINEKSPYLLQHAHNPIDWYPWSDAAFRKAAAEDKPIFLSIGYSSCHWCHVMTDESFEDDAVAEIMNNHFVAIKVDREERPDIDSIYMTVCQVFTGSGGWPLTVLMTPEKKPFFAGTYFPKEAKYGRPGLIELLNEIIRVWRDDRSKLIQSGEQVTEALQQLSAYQPGEALTVNDLGTTYKHFLQQFDGTYGGFGVAPKFPSPHNLSFLLRWWKRTGESDALVMVERTLEMMHRGGIFDHLGKGFHRYSTDPVWLIPHFEKMLYDQAMLAIAYIEARQATGKQLYADVANMVFEYVLRDMTSPEGGFYSAEDADSEGEEGRFYVWTIDEIKSILDEKDADLFIKYFGLTEKGNFENAANALYIARDIDELAKDEGISRDDYLGSIEKSSRKLFNIRGKRPRPFKDDKILTDWNGLMIAALAKAAQVLDKPEYAEAAGKAADFILAKMRREDGRLLHRYRDGEAAILAYANDYAFLTWGLIELYEATFDVKFLREAIRLNDEMLGLFWDDANGGLYFTAEDNEELITRTKEIHDGAIPSGNSVAALNLLRLGRITANTEYEDKANGIIKAFGSPASGSPTGFAQFYIAVDLALGPSKEIVIAGNPDDKATMQMVNAVRSKFIPNKVIVLRPDDDAEILEIAPYIGDIKKVDGKATAYVCQNFSCKAPTTDFDELKAYLDQ